MTDTNVRWSEPTLLDSGICERGLSFAGQEETIPGILWCAEDGRPARGLVLIGHAGFSNKRSDGMLDLATRWVTQWDVAALALDAPFHGERKPARIEDPPAQWGAWVDYWKRVGSREIAEDWRTALRVTRARPEYADAAAGYWGLSLGTQYGMGVVAAIPELRGAVLGLFGLRGRHLREDAGRVRCPAFFIAQEQDEFHTVESTRALFDAVGSEEKVFRASPGGHFVVPDAVRDEAMEFLGKRVT